MTVVELVTIIVGVLSLLLGVVAGVLGAGVAFGVNRGTMTALRTDVDHLQTLCRTQSARIDELYQTILEGSR